MLSLVEAILSVDVVKLECRALLLVLKLMSLRLIARRLLLLLASGWFLALPFFARALAMAGAKVA